MYLILANNEMPHSACEMTPTHDLFMTWTATLHIYSDREWGQVGAAALPRQGPSGGADAAGLPRQVRRGEGPAPRRLRRHRQGQTVRRRLRREGWSGDSWRNCLMSVMTWLGSACLSTQLTWLIAKDHDLYKSMITSNLYSHTSLHIVHRLLTKTQAQIKQFVKS